MRQTNHAPQIQKSSYSGARRTSYQASRAEVYEGHLVLVNLANPVRQPLPPGKLTSLSSNPAIHELHEGMLLEHTCLRHFNNLLEACQGMDAIVAVSGYRTKEEQERIYESSLNKNGTAYTARYVALPDRSEHQTGLAVDVGWMNGNVDFIAPSFPDSGIYMTFKQLAAQYGFIQRYKEGKESITHISCEPWHFRYVGYPHAQIMEQNNLCLEEYIDFIQGCPYAGSHLSFENEALSVEIYFVQAEEGPSTKVPIAPCDYYSLSGNNRDGFIVTAFAGIG